MATINFKCRCPCIYCKSSGPIIQWKCQDCGSNKLINEEAKIICSGCGEHKNYIWREKFKCGNHDEDYHEISYNGMLLTLSEIGSMTNPPTGFLKKLTKQCLLHENEFLAD